MSNNTYIHLGDLMYNCCLHIKKKQSNKILDKITLGEKSRSMNNLGVKLVIQKRRMFFPDILKVYFLRSQNFSFEIWRKKKCKNITTNQLICVKPEEKTVKGLKCMIC